MVEIEFRLFLAFKVVKSRTYTFLESVEIMIVVDVVGKTEKPIYDK